MGTLDGGATWAPVELGRAVNKFRVVRSNASVDLFGIGSELQRLSMPMRPGRRSAP